MRQVYGVQSIKPKIHNTMEGIRTLVSEPDGMTWLQLKQVLDKLPTERLGDPVLIWKYPEEGGTEQAEDEIAHGFGVAIEQCTEDHINPSGEGIEPISLYDPNDFDEEDVVLKKDAIILIY